MKKFLYSPLALTSMAGFVAMATLSLYIVNAESTPSSKSTLKQDESLTRRLDVSMVSSEVSNVVHVETAEANRQDNVLPGLAKVLDDIADEPQRVQLDESIRAYSDAVEVYKESMQKLPASVATALLAGDEDAVAKAAAKTPALIEQIKSVSQRYTDTLKARDAVTAAIFAIGNPTVAADVYRIVEIIESDLPDVEKFQKILEVILRRLEFLAKALAAKSGGVSPDLVTGYVEDLEVTRGAVTRLVSGGDDDGDDNGMSTLEAYLPDGNKIEFKLPPEILLNRIKQLMNSDNSFDVSMEDGQPMLRVISPSGELLLQVYQPSDGTALIIVD